jgi:hypothetical protein
VCVITVGTEEYSLAQKYVFIVNKTRLHVSAIQPLSGYLQVIVDRLDGGCIVGTCSLDIYSY